MFVNSRARWHAKIFSRRIMQTSYKNIYHTTVPRQKITTPLPSLWQSHGSPITEAHAIIFFFYTATKRFRKLPIFLINTHGREYFHPKVYCKLFDITDTFEMKNTLENE